MALDRKVPIAMVVAILMWRAGWSGGERGRRSYSTAVYDDHGHRQEMTSGTSRTASILPVISPEPPD